MPGQRGSRRNGNGNGNGNVARGSTLLVTNLTKLAGVALAVNEAALRPSVRDSVIALCALFVIGTQAAEGVMLRAIDRFFGPPDPPPDPPAGRDGP